MMMAMDMEKGMARVGKMTSLMAMVAFHLIFMDSTILTALEFLYCLLVSTKMLMS